eukprot:scaffold112622_cov28-Tisochrysis_lutea.AAC.2
MVDVGLVVATLGGVVAQRAVAQMAEGVAGLRGAKVGEAANPGSLRHGCKHPDIRRGRIESRRTPDRPGYALQT